MCPEGTLTGQPGCTLLTLVSFKHGSVKTTFSMSAITWMLETLSCAMFLNTVRTKLHRGKSCHPEGPGGRAELSSQGGSGLTQPGQRWLSAQDKRQQWGLLWGDCSRGSMCGRLNLKSDSTVRCLKYWCERLV
ncbi:hypothetical protein AAES_56184 [Amazona aestiva]|uniref:Uncharacterized protein n=1 Tax=Amazona aestiva TaxID=12930 RepID=A0A0Q3MNE0_AMAAE|nr:hypothetical protein AAES_56184 [Amazona aestiva]